MASSMFSNPDDHPLPAEGSLYYDYLEDMPVGLTMSFDLVPDAEELDEEDREAVLFTAKKTSVGKWVGVPYKTGAVSTKILFDHVRECLPGEETMVVTLGCDPRKVKKEYVERGEEEAEESSPIIMSIHPRRHPYRFRRRGQERGGGRAAEAHREQGDVREGTNIPIAPLDRSSIRTYLRCIRPYLRSIRYTPTAAISLTSAAFTAVQTAPQPWYCVPSMHTGSALSSRT